MNRIKISLSIACGIVLYGVVVICTRQAYMPQIVTQQSLHDITSINAPESAQVFYGALSGFPHTYEIVSEKPFVLNVQIRVPDIASQKNEVSGIVIKNRKKGRVEEVARLRAGEALWTSHDDFLTGDRYREGALFRAELDAGEYRIEVHTPNNAEKYMLAVGENDNLHIGYIEFLRRLLHIKEFYEKSPLLIVQSPYVYWPMGVVVVIGFLVFLYIKKYGLPQFGKHPR